MRASSIDVLWIARYDYQPGWGLQPHDHDYFQLVLFLEGNALFTVAGQSFPIRGGELFLIRPAETHGLRSESHLRTLDVKFRVSPGPLAQALTTAARFLHWSLGGLAARLERIRDEGDKKAPWYRELCGALLAELLYLYLRQIPQAAPPGLPHPSPELAPHNAVLQRAIAYIQSHIADQITVVDMARAAGCSDRSLRTHFRKGLSTTPLTFLHLQRTTKARELIQYSDYSLKEIARLVGFQTIHHFTRLFTSAAGCSPAAWRRQYLQGIRKDINIDPRFTNRIVTVGI